MVQECSPFACAGDAGGRDAIRWGVAAFLCPVLFIGGACADGGGVRSIETRRVVEGAAAELRWDAGPAERFGLQPLGAASGSAASAWSWTTPASWLEVAPSSMRAADFRVAGDPRAECYLTVLPGDAGGLTANVNRWRGQMSLPPLDGASVAALPSAELLGEPATWVDFEGTYSGMGGEARAEYRMVGLLSIAATGSRFLKMVGPRDVIAAEVEAFRQLADSFRAAAAPRATRQAPSKPGSDLTWDVPAGWRPGPERPYRAASFWVGDGEELECYVSVLSGDGGGALANVNRWFGQMGAAPLERAQLAELERVTVLGNDSLFVEIPGAYRGMGGESVESALLLGVLSIGPDRSVFVKLIGPAARVEAARADFMTFCRSLRNAR